MYKLIVSDLDGTLLNEHHVVSEYSKSVIKKLQKVGKIIYLATGRHYEDAKKIYQELDLDAYLISSNGGMVHNKNNEKIYSFYLDKKIAKEISELEVSKDLHFNFFTEKNHFVYEEAHWIKEFIKDDTEFIPEIINEWSEKEEILKMFYVSDKYDELLKVQNEIIKKYGNYVDVMFSLPTILEIIPKGVSKANAIKSLAKKEKISKEHIIAFGDGFNDLDMLKTVGKGLIMGNAHDKLKKALPNNEIILTNRENGVAKYLESLFYSNL